MYYYMYYRITVFFLHPLLNGKKAKSIKEGTSGGWAIMSLTMSGLICGILYWGFAYPITGTSMKIIPFLAGIVNLCLIWKKGLIKQLSEKYRKENSFKKYIRGWLVFFVVVFIAFIQLIWAMYHQKDAVDFEGFIAKIIDCK